MDIGVTVNKKETMVPSGITVSELLAFLDYPNSRVAVWIDGRQLLLAEYPVVKVEAGQKLVIHRIVAGG